ncbi:delta(3,5)-Delta(2,4)-dienoyl-CoA isomerase, mitochondrial isoform X2 [Manduca sexta]|uniref:delta(3,5)-Delta(2,4)-dienoyl-CoA isomerase, mitochondrial isoform X2 n=1 Tax=Manduca sexta TaxID=7130 RepID=UPI00188E3D5F|nr:delta(3,5)-Delta(2,4)-dienoyl-CoA isomerase, mitochondrial isoform X2 [Manduca sexta]
MSVIIKTLVLNQTRKSVGFLRRTYSSEVPQYETLAVSVPKKHVFHVELNRPKKLNTLNRAMWRELNECFSTLSNNSECRVIVLSGQGKHFTGGIELQSLVELASEADDLPDVARRARFHYGFIKFAQDGITSLEKCVKPVLSVVHNACIGAGVDLITAADIRYCTEDAWFQVKEVEVGLAADVGTLQRLPKVVGNTSIARELCFTGRKFDAKEAKEIGLVSKVFPDQKTALSHALEVAEGIAAKSPVAVQTTKLSLVYSQSRPSDDGLEHIRLLNSVMNQGEDLPKAAIAQATKSPPPEFDNL